MSAMIDRVARSLYENLDDGGHDGWGELGESGKEPWLRAARVVLAAIREPTEAMIWAGCVALRDVPPSEFMAAELSGDRHATAKMKMPLRWRAMIDEVLK